VGATLLHQGQILGAGLIGEIKAWTALSVPDATWVFADGSLLLRANYPELFALYDADGLLWGPGDGSTTFGIPDLRGQVPMGAGTGGAFTPRALAAAVGAETHALSSAENGAHAHGASGGSVSIPRLTSPGTLPSSTPSLVATGFYQSVPQPSSTFSVGGSTQSAGSGSPHNIMQPSLALNFILKALP